MQNNIKALRGMADILPAEAEVWQFVENTARSLFRQFGYDEIRTPLLEETALFKRSIGTETDIVQKQMYSFHDRGGKEITIRPEGTASCVRAYLEHNIGRGSAFSKLYYIGPMFRNERPQAGRLRQFYQIGAEAIGSVSPYIDAELISLMMKILEGSRLDGAELRINSLGCENDKKLFEQTLKKTLLKEVPRLCGDCKKRYESNILRIFDCKNAACRQLLRSLPKIIDYLCSGCKGHFAMVNEALDTVGIRYTISPFLVRGLDYYTGVVFEVTHKELGSQDAVCAGGRYDNLIKDMGGEDTPACGFAIGLERVLLAAKNKIGVRQKAVELFLIGLGNEAQKKVFKILSDLRNKGVVCQMGLDERSLKSQMRSADKNGARKVLIIGDEELKNGVAVLRDMETKEQKEIRLTDVTDTHLW